MNVRILDEHDVRRLLPMAECIDVMADALASLARDELYNPLRFVIRPPGAQTLMGLMPAHRSSPDPLYSLKTVVIAPANAERGLDLHQGFVALFDGVTGETRALLNAGGITAVRTAAVSGVATRLLAREDARTLAILGAGIQAKAHLEAMRAVRDFDRVLVWSRTPGRAAELDGAGAFRQLRHITLPMISPILLLNLILGVVASFQAFARVYIMTQGGPGNSTDLLGIFIYRQSFQNLRLGYGSAVSWTLFAGMLILTMTILGGSRRFTYYETGDKL